MKTQKESKVTDLLFFNLSPRCGWVVSSKPRQIYPGKDTRFPFYSGFCGPQSRSGREKKIPPLTGKVLRIKKLSFAEYPLAEVKALLDKCFI